MFNANLHPSVFQNKLPPQPEKRTIDSVAFERSIPVDLRVAPRRNYNLYSNPELDSEDKSYASTVLSGIQTDTKLARVYFSKRNIDHLQKVIRTKVFLESGGSFDSNGAPVTGQGHVVGKQSETQLLIFMRYIYMSYCTFPTDCSDGVVYAEVNRLNDLVVTETVPNILEHVEAHLGYIRDASRIPDPISRSLATTNAGTRQLRSVTEVLGAEF